MLKNLRRKTLRDIRANRGQFLAVWLVVTLGIAFYGAMYPAAVNMLKSFYKTYDELHYMDFQAQMEPVAPDVVDDVLAVPGVAHAEGRLVVECGLQLKPEQRYRIDLRLISVPDDREPEVNRNDITNGHDLQEPGDILLLKSFADFHHIHPGDSLRVSVNGQEVTLRVVGLAFNAEYLVAGSGPASPFPTPSSFGVAWMRYSELAALSGMEGQINEVVVQLQGKAGENKSSLEKKTRRTLETLFPGAAIYSRIQTASGGVVDANINGNFPIMIFFSGAFLVGSTVITGVLLARLVESERQRIGTMRAMGITRWELMLHYLAYGLLIGVSGGLAGSILGYLNSFWVMNTYIHYIAGGTLPEFVNTPQWTFILLGLAVVMLGSTFAGAYPAWVQSGTAPGIALRPMAPKTPNMISRIQLRFLPSPLRWAIRNILRVPGRSLSTALGVMAGAMMIFASFVLWDTMNETFAAYYHATDFDLQVNMGTLQPGDQLEQQIRQVQGITWVEAALIGPVTVLQKGQSPFETVVLSVDEQNPAFGLTTMDGSPAFSSADGVWIGHNLERVLDVHTGDILALQVNGQERQAEVKGIVSYTLGSPVFVPRRLLVTWIPGGVFPANTAFVRVEPGQMGVVRNALVDLPGMRAVLVMPDFEADIDRYLTYFRVGTLIFGSFGYTLTLAVLFNTVNGSLRERRDELSVLRALGFRRGEIAVMVTLEMLLMALLGAAVGIPIGRQIGFYLNHTYDTDFFGQVNTLRLVSYLFGLGSLILIVLLAEIPGLRAVQRTDLGQVSKSQSF